MVPVTGLFRGPKNLVKRQGHTYDTDHGPRLRLPSARRRWGPAVTIAGGWPLVLRLSSPAGLPSRKVSQLESLGNERLMVASEVLEPLRGTPRRSATCRRVSQH
jgi:hypothetical protein